MPKLTTLKPRLSKWDARRDEAKAYRKLYGSARWCGKHGARQAQLAKEPLCERCKAMGRITIATVVNHRKPHKGNFELFFDPNNHESTCKPHHDGTIQSEERTGIVKGNGLDGRPTDASHPWNR